MRIVRASLLAFILGAATVVAGGASPAAGAAEAPFGGAFALATGGTGVGGGFVTQDPASGSASIVLKMRGGGLDPGLYALEVHGGTCGAIGDQVVSTLPPAQVEGLEAGGYNIAFTLTATIEGSLRELDGGVMVLHSLPNNRASIPERYGPADATTLATGDVGAPVACGAIDEIDFGGAAVQIRSTVKRELADAGTTSGGAEGARSLPGDLGRADLRAGGEVIGRVELIRKASTILVSARGLTPGAHSLQLHSAASCAAPGALVPGTDLPELVANGDGDATAIATVDVPTLAALRADNGSSFVVHAGSGNHANIPARYGGGPDATTLATHDAGAAVACGPIRAVAIGERYADAIYQQLLGRVIDPGGAATWRSVYNHNGPALVARRIIASGEARGALVDGAYQSLLLIDPDPAGRAYWVGYLGSSRSRVEIMEANLYGSDAFFARVGNTKAGYTFALTGDPEDPLWRTYLDLGGSRTLMAKQILTSDEAYATQIENLFQTYVERSATLPEFALWLSRVHRGGDLRPLRSELLASPLFVGRATTPGGFDGILHLFDLPGFP